MILAVDVQYTENKARIAGVTFKNWPDQSPQQIYISSMETVAAYEPGMFFKRELPCILKLIEAHGLKPTTIVIDGYVYLDGHSRAGLGKHLYDALEGETIVIGVAKKPFKDIDARYKVYRGESKRPLYVTAAGIDIDQAITHITSMHGNNRLPTLIKRVDQICRDL